MTYESLVNFFAGGRVAVVGTGILVVVVGSNATNRRNHTQGNGNNGNLASAGPSPSVNMPWRVGERSRKMAKL